MMNVEKIAAKLRPIMPGRIEHLMRSRQMADSELKSLIEKQIFSIGHRVFGNIDSKILLSLPPESKAKGSINLGNIMYDSEKYPIGISSGEMLQNTAILGRSGAGKTNVTFHILKQLADKKIPFVFMDWKRTARHLIPNFRDKMNVYTPGRSLLEFPFNPFIVPPGIESGVYVNQLVDVMSQAFTLGDGARSVLRKSIVEVYSQGNLSPTAEDIMDELKKVPDSGRIGGWKVTAMRALESLEFASLSSKDRISQQQLAKKMLCENTVIELDALAQESKKFLIPLLCLWLYYVRLESPEREKLKLVIFIEEAHHVLHKRSQTSHETILEMLFRQCRELGIGIVVIDQHPHLLSSAALGNTYTTIFLNQKDPLDINKAAGVCLLDADEKKFFSMLPVGQGIVKLQDRWMQPVHVKFPLVDIKKGFVTDEALLRYSALKNASKSTDSGRNTSDFGGDIADFALPAQRVPQVRLYDKPLDRAALAFLNDVINNPDDGVKERYKRLNLSIGRGDRLKNELLDRKWLTQQTVDIGQTRKVVLRLSKHANEALGIESIQPQYHGSIVHEYWKRYYAQRFIEQGYRVSFEIPRLSGRVDVVAKKDDRRIAIEIETGKSDFMRNLRQDLLGKYDRILIVATNKQAYEKIEKAIAKEGLLIPDKIRLILRDRFDCGI